MNKLIFFDTETTGLDPKDGHRIVEIGAVVMKNGIIMEDKDCVFHYYINPERIIGDDVVKIHGITNEKVKNSPRFIDIAEKFLEFIKDATLVAHNAKFDLKFLNFQLNLIGLNEIQNKIIDTLILAKSKFPGSPASLDSLCKRFDISLRDRSFHGALLDSKLLACVYRKIMSMNDDSDSLFSENTNSNNKTNIEYIRKKDTLISSKNSRYIQVFEDEAVSHRRFLDEIFGLNSTQN